LLLIPDWLVLACAFLHLLDLAALIQELLNLILKLFAFVSLVC